MNILIVEDNDAAASTISSILRLSYHDAKITVCRTGYEAVESVNSDKADLVLLDLGLPDMNGLKVLDEIRPITGAPIIVVTACEDEENVLKALEQGADEYITKPFRHLEFLARVKKALSKNISQNTAIIKSGDITIDCAKHELSFRNDRVFLTRVETMIMSLLLQRNGQIVDYRDISDALWGHAYPGSDESIRVYVSRLRLKIEKNLKAGGIIKNEAGIGYRLSLAE
ncbi:MAG: response regulator transcription factor [Dehalococcoides mccartyi]|uniref:response regulator transcription factor n=1 Tax=Dehalococcoides TaxID=61434 RepID=UPI002737C655|nr:response regulator transcription factor [Dehalococcoides mccartyi]MDP4279427.1 response regulator transcription factor [Dehalococcoides mccartyi]